MIGSASVQPDINALLDILSCADNADHSGGGKFSIQKGLIKVHGREVKDWDISYLRNKFIIMKESEKQVPLSLGPWHN